jgi:hypothetical protein
VADHRLRLGALLGMSNAGGHAVTEELTVGSTQGFFAGPLPRLATCQTRTTLTAPHHDRGLLGQGGVHLFWAMSMGVAVPIIVTGHSW